MPFNPYAQSTMQFSVKPSEAAVKGSSQQSPWSQSTESMVSIMRSDSGQAAGHWDSLVVWMVNILTCLPIPLFPSLSLSDWMCLHSWVVTGKEPFKISCLLLPLSPSPYALHSVLLHYLGNTIMSTLLPSTWISYWGMSTTLQHVGL